MSFNVQKFSLFSYPHFICSGNSTGSPPPGLSYLLQLEVCPKPPTAADFAPRPPQLKHPFIPATVGAWLCMVNGLWSPQQRSQSMDPTIIIIFIIIIFIYLFIYQVTSYHKKKKTKTATSSTSITKASKYAIPLKPNTNLQSQCDI